MQGQFGEGLAAGLLALGHAAPFPQARGLGVVAVAEISVEIALLVDDSALDEGSGPGGEHGGAQRF